MGVAVTYPAFRTPDDASAFGPFRLFPRQRLLLNQGERQLLGSRALDILIALVEQRGEVVSKKVLMERVWPDTHVVDGNLTVHLSALRRALRDGMSGNRYIITIPGHGYCFVAPVEREPCSESLPAVTAEIPRQGLPMAPTPLVGRTEVIGYLTGILREERFVTIVGPGGVGKTAVACAAARALAASFGNRISFVDLAPIVDPTLLSKAVTEGLAFACTRDAPFGRAAPRRVLLVLDNCEHMVEPVGRLIEDLLKDDPGVHVLSTSRERIHASGEIVCRLPPLTHPRYGGPLNAAEALQFTGVELFVRRTASAMSEFELSDEDAGIAADICRKVDGIPLAIELAASRVEAFGINGVSERLDDPLQLLTAGRRTAPARHRTMRAALDWSYALLSDSEQRIFRRVSVFCDEFTFGAAAAVVADRVLGEEEVIDKLAMLVGKSLVAADLRDREPRLSLLKTTRAYAISKLNESGEMQALGRRGVDG